MSFEPDLLKAHNSELKTPASVLGGLLSDVDD